jgi:hypothetical protein
MSAENVQQPAQFQEWCLVEQMGHRKYAGFAREQTVAGSSLLRIDVPEVTEPSGRIIPAFTKLIGGSSIFSLTPCTEETARAYATGLRVEAFDRYALPSSTPPRTITYLDDHDDLEDRDVKVVDDADYEEPYVGDSF